MTVMKYLVVAFIDGVGFIDRNGSRIGTVAGSSSPRRA